MFWEAVTEYGAAEDRSADRLLRMVHAWEIFNKFIAVDGVHTVGMRADNHYFVLSVNYIWVSRGTYRNHDCSDKLLTSCVSKQSFWIGTIMWTSIVVFLSWQPTDSFYHDNPLVPFTISTHGSFYHDNPLVHFTITTHWSLLPWKPTGHFYYDNPQVPFTLTIHWSLLQWQRTGPFYYNNPLGPFTLTTHWSLLQWQPTVPFIP